MKLFFPVMLLAIMSCSSTQNNGRGSSMKANSETYEEAEGEIAQEDPIITYTSVEGPIQIDVWMAQDDGRTGSYLKLFETEGKDYFLIDSAKIEGAKAIFELSSAQTGIYKLGFESAPEQLIDLILNPEEGQVKMEFRNANFKYGYIQSDSKENQAYQEYLELKKRHDREVASLQRSNMQREDKRRAIFQEQTSFKKVQESLASKYPETWFAYMVNQLQSPNRFDKSKYWSDMNFKDKSLIHSTVYPDRIEDYMRNHASKERSETEPRLGFYNAVDEIAMKVKENGNDEVLEFVLYTMSEGFYSSGMEDLSLYVVDNYFYGDACGDAEISELFKMKAAGIRKLQVGNIPPDIRMKGADNKLKSLKSIAAENDLTLVLFWASFCHKCEREIPDIKKLYQGYKNKGFEVLAVSVDKSREDWIGGINTHQTNWPNVCDMKGWRGQAAQDFRVTSTPVMFLVDEHMEIVFRPRNAEELSQYLKNSNKLNS